MGPFSWDQYKKRYARLDALASNHSLPKEMSRMWARKRDGLAQTEAEYNRRVKEIYQNVSRIRL